MLKNERSVMEGLLRDLGLDVAEVMNRASSPDIKGQLRAAVEEATRLGIFGAPTFITADGELFWGNDRLEQVEHWLGRGGW